MKNATSTFALLDVMKGRKKLAKRIKAGETRIPITIQGFITGQWGGDDGISIEFEFEVTKLTEESPQ
ncbi:MAG: hypothetical protein GC184_06115 [Rhizobiales bacterium]|nr:hypothetical protein [Hyphomicrobiales bacterium]